VSSLSRPHGPHRYATRASRLPGAPPAPGLSLLVAAGAVVRGGALHHGERRRRRRRLVNPPGKENEEDF